MAKREPMLTVAEVIRAVGAVKTAKGDPGVAHSLEDALYVRILREVAAGDSLVALLAHEALKTQRIDFPRWTE
jgi:hypothetical protein